MFRINDHPLPACISSNILGRHVEQSSLPLPPLPLIHPSVRVQREGRQKQLHAGPTAHPRWAVRDDSSQNPLTDGRPQSLAEI